MENERPNAFARKQLVVLLRNIKEPRPFPVRREEIWSVLRSKVSIGHRFTTAFGCLLIPDSCRGAYIIIHHGNVEISLLLSYLFYYLRPTSY